MTSALYLSVADDNGEARLFLANCLDPADRSLTLDAIRAVVGEGIPSLDDRSIEQIVTAFDLPSDGELALVSPVRVWRFLRRHEGKAASLVSVAAPLSVPTLAPAFLPDSTPVDIEPVEVPEIIAPPEPGLWETAAGVAAWRETLALTRPDHVAAPSRLRRWAAWGAGATSALLVAALNLMLADGPSLAHALGMR